MKPIEVHDYVNLFIEQNRECRVSHPNRYTLSLILATVPILPSLQTGNIVYILSSFNSQRMCIICPVCNQGIKDYFPVYSAHHNTHRFILPLCIYIRLLLFPDWFYTYLFYSRGSRSRNIFSSRVRAQVLHYTMKLSEKFKGVQPHAHS